jgi:hypothetical protein
MSKLGLARVENARPLLAEIRIDQEAAGRTPNFAWVWPAAPTTKRGGPNLNRAANRVNPYSVIPCVEELDTVRANDAIKVAATLRIVNNGTFLTNAALTLVLAANAAHNCGRLFVFPPVDLSAPASPTANFDGALNDT